MSDEHLTNEDLAAREKVSINTVRKWRATGAGPRAFKVGRHVRYRLVDVEAWEEQRLDPDEGLTPAETADLVGDLKAAADIAAQIDPVATDGDEPF